MLQVYLYNILQLNLKVACRDGFKIDDRLCTLRLQHEQALCSASPPRGAVSSNRRKKQAVKDRYFRKIGWISHVNPLSSRMWHIRLFMLARHIFQGRKDERDKMKFEQNIKNSQRDMFIALLVFNSPKSCHLALSILRTSCVWQ